MSANSTLGSEFADVSGTHSLATLISCCPSRCIIGRAVRIILVLIALLLLGFNHATAAADLTFDNVDVIDTSLGGKLAVLRVGGEVGTNKLLSIFVTLRNKTGHTLELEIGTIYKDGYGNALNSGSWIPFTLKAHEEKEYHSTSISELASADSDYLVRVRSARPAHR